MTPPQPGAATYCLESRHSAWHSLGIVTAVLVPSTILTHAVAIGITLLTLPEDYPLQPDGSIFYRAGVVLGLSQQYSTGVGILVQTAAIALAGFLLIRSVFRSSTIVVTQPGAEHPARHHLEVQAATGRLGWPIVLSAAATLCTLGGALAYYLPWCISAVGRTATGRAPARTGGHGNTLTITSRLERRALAGRAGLAVITIAVTGFVFFLIAIPDLQELPELPEAATDAEVAAWWGMAGPTALLLFGSAAAGILLLVIPGWFLSRYAVSQLQIHGADGTDGQLAVAARGTTLYLTKWVAICLVTGGVGLLFYPGKVLARALNHARTREG